MSPECLDDVQQYLSPRGVMIPTNYTSFIAPITAARVWMGTRDIPNRKGIVSSARLLNNLSEGLETPFVVKLHACHYIHQSLPVFTFTHPRTSDNNTR